MHHEPQGINRHRERTTQRTKELDLKGIDLSALEAFREVARQHSFSRAAASLGVTPTALSKKIKRFESQLGTRLLSRTSRAVQLTTEGARFLDLAGPALNTIESAAQSLNDEMRGVGGQLKVTVPAIAYSLLIEPHLGNFWRAYPDLDIEISIDDGLRDIVAEGFDAGVRLGERLALDMIAVPLSSRERMMMVASPGYLETARPIASAHDLAHHECIRFRLPTTRAIYPWRLTHGSSTIVVDVGGRLILDSVRAIQSAAIAGCGIAYTFARVARPAIESGQLVQILAGSEYEHAGWFAYFSSRHHVPARLRTFIDFFRASNLDGT